MFSLQLSSYELTHHITQLQQTIEVHTEISSSAGTPRPEVLRVR